MRYKVGDRVRIKSLDWYEKNKDEFGAVLLENGNYLFFESDTIWCGKVITIVNVCLDEYYTIAEDFGKHRWTDEMIEGLAEESKPKYEDEVELVGYSTPSYLVCPSGYEFQDENGNVINASKIVLKKKKPRYPKTYEECLSVLGIYNGLPDVEIYNAKPSECTLFESLIRLKRCRDAYWKIAGEEMGLGKPWKPDWNDKKQDKHGFYHEIKHTIINSKVFVFPTAKMRDAFYENFKELIEDCKELL